MREWQEHQRLVAISGAIFEKRRKDLVSEAASDDELDPERLEEMMAELDSGLGPTEAEAPPRLLTEDVTPEGLASLLAAHGRVICASDEGSALFENLAAATHAARSAGTCSTRRTRRSTSRSTARAPGPVIVFDPALTLVLATQPDMLRTLAGNLAPVGVASCAAAVRAAGARPRRRRHPTAAPDLLDEYERRVRDIYNDTPELELDQDDHPRPVTLAFADAARERFEHFEREINAERRELSGEDLDSDSVYLGWLSSSLARQPASPRPPLRRQVDGRLWDERARD